MGRAAAGDRRGPNGRAKPPPNIRPSASPQASTRTGTGAAAVASAFAAAITSDTAARSEPIARRRPSITIWGVWIRPVPSRAA